MIKRRSVLKLMAAPALMTVARPGFAPRKRSPTPICSIPAYDAVTWAMTNGKVSLRPDRGRSARARDPAADPGHLGQAVRRDHDRRDRDPAGGGARPRAEGAVDRAAAVAQRRRRRRLGQERFADQEPEGAQGQVARLLCAALDRLHPGAAARSSRSTDSMPRLKAEISSRSRSRRRTCPARWRPARSTPRR